MRRIALSACLLLGLAACAGGPPPGEPGEAGSRGQGRGPLLNVFFSPMGEPVRGRPLEPYASRTWFERVNVAHDGKLTEKEFLADAAQFFDRLDANHDGVIDGFEVEDYERKIAPEIQPHVGNLRPGEGMDLSLGRGDGGGRGQGRGAPQGGPISNRQALAGDVGRQGAGAFSWLPDPEPVAAASSGLNDRITRDDWMQSARRRFARLDFARRGFLALADLPKPPAQVVFEQRRKAMEKRGGPEGAGPGAPRGDDGDHDGAGPMPR
jgi:hypothetical protein